MSYGGYQQYGGNPYGQDGGNPYEGGAQEQSLNPPPALQHEASNYSESSNYNTITDAASPPGVPAAYMPNQAQQSRPPMSMPDFLARIEGVRGRMRELTTHISEVQTHQQRILSSPDSTSSARLDALVNQTQILNTTIKDEIKYLEVDAKRTGSNATKNSQVRTVKDTFKKQLEQYRTDEQQYEARYREQIKRQFKIVNPEATEDEANDAANADWGNEGVFQTALKTNRTATASSVLGAVRARHNDIQKIERTLIELAQLFQDLATEVEAQEYKTVEVEQQTENVHKDTENANVQLGKGIVSARRRRKLQWWTLFVVILIVCILALVLGLYFGLKK